MQPCGPCNLKEIHYEPLEGLEAEISHEIYQQSAIPTTQDSAAPNCGCEIKVNCLCEEPPSERISKMSMPIIAPKTPEGIEKTESTGNLFSYSGSMIHADAATNK
ncbi:uncharacterized protein LOC126367191 [Pectinophora gossypiella]|uniref:uncharacterized protein LOC126367191 n=1 Tax=Pectinophora gossypiella TaxID=13191 RepID=UPI00214E9B8B|nr:uncharacterized protein LOC126367191 [Pectinophora gossypiella]